MKGLRKRSSSLRAIGVFPVIMVAILGFIAPPTVGASTSSCGTELCVVSSQCETIAGNPAVALTYHSTETFSLTAVAVADVQDFLGYVVASVTSTFSIGPNGNTTVNLQLRNLPQGNYNVTAYAYNPSFTIVLSGAFLISCTSGTSLPTLPTGTQTLTLAKPLSPCVGGCLSGTPYVDATYHNNLGFTLTAVAYMVVLNSQGQVAYYSTATLVIKPGGNSTALLVLAGLPHGSYSATAFTVAPSVQYVLSEASTINFTL